MADEVPVSDILCNAMEYLSKLGSNLRSRSEILKEKRIRKDKLKNAHAVQKAAHKVLLICELSKKSLDNVESSVRNIMNLVDASQASIRDGGKFPTSEKSHTKFQYFEYKKKKLKVSKKVPLKHYLSVKVLAKSMSTSIQDKYPVYYDCKLYRLRKRIAKKDKSENSADQSLRRNGSVDPAERPFEDTDKPSKKDNCESSEDESVKYMSLDKNKDKKDRRNSNGSDRECKERKRSIEAKTENNEEKNGDDGPVLIPDSNDESDIINESESSRQVKVLSYSSKSAKRKRRTDSELSKAKDDSDLDNSISPNDKHDKKKNNSRLSPSVSESVTKKSSRRKESEDSNTKKSKDDEAESESDIMSSSRKKRKDSLAIESKVDDSESDSDEKKSSSLRERKNSDAKKSKDNSESESDGKKSSSRKEKKDLVSIKSKVEDSDPETDGKKSSSLKERKDLDAKKSESESDLKKSSSHKEKKDSVAKQSEDDSNSESDKKKSSSCKERKDSDDDSKHEKDRIKSSNRKERKGSVTRVSKHDDSDPETDRKKSLSRKKHRKDSVTKKCKGDDLDSESDTRKSSIRKERKGSVKGDDSESESDVKKSSSCNENRRDSATHKPQSGEDDNSNKESDTDKFHSNGKDSSKSMYESKSKKEKEIKAKKFKHIRVLDDSSTSDQEESQNAKAEVIDLASDDDNANSRLSPERRPSTEKSVSDSRPDEDQKVPKTLDCETEDKSNDSDQSQNSKAESQRPIIKCVSLSKLLKPDVLPIIKKIEHENSSSEIKSSLNKDKKVKKPHSRAKQIKYEDEEEFWEQKRKQVKAFKPKDFVINITRLPTLSVKFLIEHKLKKITQNGSSICKVTDKSIDSDTQLIEQSKQSTSKEKSSVKADDSVISKVKNDLLNDSDSEKSDSNPRNSLKNVSKNGKNSQLDKSDSDQNKTIENQHSEDKTENCETSIQNSLLDESDSDKNDANEIRQSKDRNQNEETSIKNSLLFESDSDKNETNENQQSEGRTENCETSKTFEETDPVQKEQSTEKEPQAELLEKGEKTPDRKLSPIDDPDKVKSSLLKDSSEESPKTPHSKRKSEDDTTPNKSKRKHIMESMHAKKMLLTYSSSSETEDEELNNVIKEIKDTLLKEINSGDENAVKQSVCKKLLASSDSDEDVTKSAKKKRMLNKSKSPFSETEDGDKKSCDVQDEDADKEQDTSCIDQVDGTVDEGSSSSTSKMGRSRGKPGASSSQNSDTQDDKDIDGLTNLKTLNKRSRTRSEKASTSKKRDKKMPKAAPLITGEGLLEAPSSSEEASEAAESEAADEDLPAVKLSGLNGSGIGHLAKDDLLGESDSSSSTDKEKSTEETKKDGDSDTEDNLKARRRKANAISSDSEGGSSRARKKKDADVRLSDFEDSGSDSSDTAKKAKRKKKGSDSDASAGGSSNEGGKKKRRRIKQIDSEGSGSDSENEGKNKHGRKNIRRVMGKNQLEEATKKAAREEKERMARIAERQKMYNNLQFDESGKPDEVVLDKVVLDFDPETKEPLIEVDRGLVKKLKPHQANGIKFMWDACFESVKRIKKDKGSGCILAHCMGLGKTLQVVSLTHTLLTHSKMTGVTRVLVVCPLSTVLNWVNEFNMWLKHAKRDYDVDVYELSRYKQNSERAFQLSQWYECGGVCVLGYEMFRNLSADNPKKFKKKMLRNFQEALVDPGPHMVVCDEGHLLKNEKTSLSQSMNRVKTLRRIVLTGTPLQNNLKEYYCMVQFVKPNLLGKYNEYLNRFVNPITNGQYTDSTEYDIKIMKRRSHVLHKMLDGAVQRRDYGVLAPFLPPKHEYVLFITLTELQLKLYQHYLDNYARRPLAGKSSGFLFPDFQSLQRIWTHPLVLKYNSERYEIQQQKKRDKEEEDSEGSLVDFIDDDSTGEETSSEESSDDSSDMSDDSRKKSKKKEKKKSKGKDSKATGRRATRSNPVELVNEEMKDPDIVEVKNDNPTEWWISLVSDDELEDMRNSHKLVLLFEILRQCEAIGDKLLVFSQSLYSLDLIEEFLRKVDEATQEGRIDEKLGGHVGSWSPGVDYFRLDGSTSCENRSIWCKNFNREDNPRARLFLISTRAGGLGINLVAANRVVIFDVSWNPSHDVQSIFRVYRFGQKKPCYIYRFLAMGTMEEKIYERQVTKQAISKRVIDEQQIDRHYAANDLAELYTFSPTPPLPRPVPPVPKDRFFAEMLKEHEALIYKFHEHDSLLENKEEETLSEEERKAAWDDFENEKNRPPPAPFPSGWPMNMNGMMPNMLAQQQQQQQLAYAALATMLRKEMPNVSDDQIRSMLPLIYGANPALMQKLSDMYKYTQPGMMNPATMMNPAMNAASAGAAVMGGGGSSGLQYEPPWQRQQQQQQQMRMQQLLQQQQAMGQKYYAGGLGSRDPIAMAMQQQRAREIMLGDRGRARGRPPLEPRLPSAAPAPAAASGDVVDLDSD